MQQVIHELGSAGEVRVALAKHFGIRMEESEGLDLRASEVEGARMVVERREPCLQRVRAERRAIVRRHGDRELSKQKTET